MRTRLVTLKTSVGIINISINRNLSRKKQDGLPSSPPPPIQNVRSILKLLLFQHNYRYPLKKNSSFNHTSGMHYIKKNPDSVFFFQLFNGICDNTRLMRCAFFKLKFNAYTLRYIQPDKIF